MAPVLSNKNTPPITSKPTSLSQNKPSRKKTTLYTPPGQYSQFAKATTQKTVKKTTNTEPLAGSSSTKNQSQKDSQKTQSPVRTQSNTKVDTSSQSETEEDSDDQTELASDGDHTPQTTNTNIEDTDPLQDMRQEILDLCTEPAIPRKRRLETERALKAIVLSKALLDKSTRTPKYIVDEIHVCFEAMTKSIFELEACLHHEEARNDVLEQIQTTTATEQKKTTQSTNKQEPRITTRRPDYCIAADIEKASATLIVKGPKERDASDVEKQLQTSTHVEQETIKKVTRIRNGVTIQCASASEAQKLK